MIEDFLDPHPDEILYSVWARFSERVRYYNKQHVFRELFGNRHAVAVVDLPCYLGYFVDHLPFGHDYTVDYFINYHTLFPFYSPFLSPEQRSRVREQMIAGNARSIYHHVGYKTGRSSTLDAESHFWLRFCPQCAEHDREVYGECYWHRLHQAQGVEICPVHKTFLENSSIRARDHVLSAEFVAAERAVGSVAPRLALSSPYFSILQDICTAIQFLLEHPDLALSREVSLSERYRILLAHQGWVTVNGHVRRTDFVNEFKNTYSRLDSRAVFLSRFETLSAIRRGAVALSQSRLYLLSAETHKHMPDS